MLLLTFIGGQKSIFRTNNNFFFESRTNNNLTHKICCENIVNVALLKKEQYTKILTTFFTTIELTNFY